MRDAVAVPEGAQALIVSLLINGRWLPSQKQHLVDGDASRHKGLVDGQKIDLPEAHAENGTGQVLEQVGQVTFFLLAILRQRLALCPVRKSLPRYAKAAGGLADVAGVGRQCRQGAGPLLIAVSSLRCHSQASCSGAISRACCKQDQSGPPLTDASRPACQQGRSGHRPG
jgi:hypothetical protein